LVLFETHGPYASARHTTIVTYCEALTLSQTSLKQTDSFNCGILCCIVALCEIVNNDPPRFICPAFWRRAFLELLGSKVVGIHPQKLSECGMHSESTQNDSCLYHTRQYLSQDDLERLENLVKDIIGHSYMVAESTDAGLGDFDRNLILAGEFSRRFGVRQDHSYSSHVHKIIDKRRSGFKKMGSRMTADLKEIQDVGLNKTNSLAEV
jgi:hypothetical protein